MAKKDVPGDPKKQGLGSLARKVIKHPVLRIGSSLYDAYTALPQEIKDKVRDSILPPPDQETVGPSSFPPIEIEQNEGTGVTSLPMDEASRMQRAQDMGFGEVLYHGTGADIDEFKGITWSSESPELANEYAAMRGSRGGDDVVYPIRIKPGESFDADTLPKRVTVNLFANELMAQALKAGRKVDMPKAREQLAKIRAAFAREDEESIMQIVNDEQIRAKYGDEFVESFAGERRVERVKQNFDRHNFWFGAEEIFGEDGAQAIRDLIRLTGFDSIKMTEKGAKTIGILNPKNIRSSILAEYDPEQSESPDITKAHGGFVDKPLYDRNRSYYG